jgi:hypothetical protein
MRFCNSFSAKYGQRTDIRKKQYRQIVLSLKLGHTKLSTVEQLVRHLRSDAGDALTHEIGLRAVAGVPVSGVFLSADGPDIKWIQSGISLIVLCTSSNRALEIDPRFSPLRNIN